MATDDFWDRAGIALVILAILLGMGSCGALLNASDRCQPPNTGGEHG